MSFNLKNIVRKNIWDLKAYSSARSEFKLYGDVSPARESAESKKELTLLDANENPNDPKAHNSELITPNLNRYPDPLQSEIKEILSEQKGISTDQIFVGNGSDEAIDLLYRIFCEPEKDSVITCPPTYGMYEVSAAINDVKVIEVPLNERFELNVKQILKRVQDDKSVKLLWICSPNNPTGNILLKADLEHDWQAENYTKGGMMDMPYNPEFEAELKENKKLMDQLIGRFDGIVVVDEAYQDFTENQSFISRLEDYPNLVVLQTMSKAHGLAGARTGFAFASKEIIALFNKTKPPYNVNELSQKAVVAALKNIDKTRSQVEELIDNREILIADLQQLSFVKQVFPSEANFVLAEVEDATAVYNYLKDKSLIVRNRSSQIQNTLRFTVGTRKECEALMEALKEYKNS
ncbi:pyridoxal phosphate-dependent aminotransferase [Nonlabens ponticola]|uniref:Histidinol-phosphate aminotransferase n=1 Tax=Nonlabens ponticola TaxID=2496866 RepID=A0A3S9N0V9_9FLAO|nr:aminotransferase class I/II-fold pyridoxal phosphate-dependent enzyme [Nonlabens ponticola]AZQ45060.1 aminotransferase class I/II-fold pyridoxal phosphate-dependent enzyme [Nonlabens ponticola]